MSVSKVDFDYVYEKTMNVINAVSKVYVGKREVVKLAVVTLMAGGHLLIEGYPGTGKTLLAKALSKAIGGEYRRIQGHPDILPSDILGFHIYRPTGERLFIKGPVFSNIVLFDELNRTPTRSQAALLEAMQEYQVSIDGITYILPRPFMVVATQVPEPYATGSYKIMETLADRFSLVVPSFYNPPEEEIEIVSKVDVILNIPVEQVIALEDIDIIVKSVPYLVEVSPHVADYMVRLVTYVRTHPSIAYGPSHRVTVDLMRLSRIFALLDKRSYVIPDDVKQLFIHVVPHRVKLKEEYELEGVQPASIINEALKNVPVPK